MTKNHVILLSLFLSFVAVSCGSGAEKKSFLANATSGPSDLVELMDKGESEKFVENFLSTLPKPSRNSLWLNNGYYPSENLALDQSKRSYDYSVIGGEPKGLHITSTPVAANGKIFTIGGQGEVQARLIEDPSKILWEQVVDTVDESTKKYGVLRSVTGIFYGSDSFLGGNICYSSGAIYVTTKNGNVYALSEDDGNVIWTKEVGVPIRSAPAASAGKLIFTTSENKTYAVSTKDGKTIWVHEGLGEKSKLSYSPAALIHNDKVILTYSSGEVYQLNLSNGNEVWSTITSPSLIKVLNPSINDIGFTPVYHKGRVFVVTSDGRIVALDYASGNTLYEFEGYQISKTIWVAANSIFAINKYGKLISISITTGELVWESQLDDPEDIHDDKIFFTGPIVAENNIYVANNKGDLLVISPKDGSITDEIDIASDILLSPIVAEGRMFFVRSSGDPKLIYFR